MIHAAAPNENLPWKTRCRKVPCNSIFYYCGEYIPFAHVSSAAT